METPEVDINFFNRSSKNATVPERKVPTLDELLAPYPPDEEHYDITGDKYMFIFNHNDFEKTRYFNFKKPTSRAYTRLDVERLTSVFEGLGFFVGKLHDLTYLQILAEIQKISTLCREKPPSILIIVVLSHGGQDGNVCANDQPYNLEELTKPFVGHEQLANKPKILFVQACRGGEEDPGTVVTDGVARVSRVIPSHTDFFVLRSTVEDFVSYRVDTGSYLMQELCNVIEEYPGKEIQYIATLVHKRVAYRYLPPKQMPITYHTLTKFLILNP